MAISVHECIECNGIITFATEPELGEIVVCPDCGVDLEVAKAIKEGREVTVFQLAPDRRGLGRVRYSYLPNVFTMFVFAEELHGKELFFFPR